MNGTNRDYALARRSSAFELTTSNSVTRLGITPESLQLQYVKLVSRVCDTVDLVFSVEEVGSVAEIETKVPDLNVVLGHTFDSAGRADGEEIESQGRYSIRHSDRHLYPQLWNFLDHSYNVD